MKPLAGEVPRERVTDVPDASHATTKTRAATAMLAKAGREHTPHDLSTTT